MWRGFSVSLKSISMLIITSRAQCKFRGQCKHFNLRRLSQSSECRERGEQFSAGDHFDSRISSFPSSLTEVVKQNPLGIIGWLWFSLWLLIYCKQCLVDNSDNSDNSDTQTLCHRAAYPTPFHCTHTLPLKGIELSPKNLLLLEVLSVRLIEKQTIFHSANFCIIATNVNSKIVSDQTPFSLESQGLERNANKKIRIKPGESL